MGVLGIGKPRLPLGDETMARGGRATMAGTGRSISMFSLITDDILEPGEGVLTFDYLVSTL